MSRPVGIMLAIICLLSGLLLGGRVDAVHNLIDSRPAAEPLDQVRRLVADNFYQWPDEAAADNGARHGYVEGLGDPFSAYLDREEFRQFSAATQGRFSGIGVVLDDRNRIERVLPDTPAARSRLRAGEMIEAVDGKETADLHPDQVSTLIRGRSGTTVSLRLRGESTRTVRVRRGAIESPVVDSRRFGDVLYIRLSGFPENATSQVRSALEKAVGVRHVVIDLRGNGGGLLEQAVSISELFLSKGQAILSSQGRKRPKRTWQAGGDGRWRSLSTTVVVDSNTASASEILASVLVEQHDATLVGEKSYGKGVVEETFSLSNGDALKLTVSEYRTSTGRRVQKVGLTPSVRLSPQQLSESYIRRAVKIARNS